MSAAKALPNYLNDNYIAKALEKGKKCAEGQLKLEKCAIECITQTGENFCSEIYRVRVTYTISNGPQLEESLVLKVMLPSMDELTTNEQMMFEQVLPDMQQILDKSTLVGNVKLSARCILTDSLQRELYLMEDLSALGYKSANRCTGLDERHARLGLEKLARFHAASMVFCLKKPDVVAKLKPSCFSKGTEDPFLKGLVIDSMDYVRVLVNEWPGYAEIAEKLRRQAPFCSERLRKIVDPQNSAYNVIVHGDLWINNILFSYTPAAVTPSDAIYVDFQLCYLGSPAIDIHFFLFTSVALTVLQTKRYELLRHYYAEFTKSLAACGYPKPPPAWQMFIDELRRCEFYGYYASVCELPIGCMDKHTSEGFSLKTFTDPEAMKKKRTHMYANDRVKETLAYALDRLNELRLFDDL